METTFDPTSGDWLASQRGVCRSCSGRRILPDHSGLVGVIEVPVTRSSHWTGLDVISVNARRRGGDVRRGVRESVGALQPASQHGVNQASAVRVTGRYCTVQLRQRGTEPRGVRGSIGHFGRIQGTHRANRGSLIGRLPRFQKIGNCDSRDDQKGEKNKQRKK